MWSASCRRLRSGQPTRRGCRPSAGRSMVGLPPACAAATSIDRSRLRISPSVCRRGPRVPSNGATERMGCWPRALRACVRPIGIISSAPRGRRNGFSIGWPKGAQEPTKYRLSSFPQDIAFGRLVDLTKLRWRIERDYQELKQEIGTCCDFRRLVCVSPRRELTPYCPPPAWKRFSRSRAGVKSSAQLIDKGKEGVAGILSNIIPAYCCPAPSHCRPSRGPVEDGRRHGRGAAPSTSRSWSSSLRSDCHSGLGGRWRQGTCERLTSRFARLGVCVAHRNRPHDEEWLLIEWPRGWRQDDHEEPSWGGLIAIRRTCICCFWRDPICRLSRSPRSGEMTEVVPQSQGPSVVVQSTRGAANRLRLGVEHRGRSVCWRRSRRCLVVGRIVNRIRRRQRPGDGDRHRRQDSGTLAGTWLTRRFCPRRTVLTELPHPSQDESWACNR